MFASVTDTFEMAGNWYVEVQFEDEKMWVQEYAWNRFLDKRGTKRDNAAVILSGQEVSYLRSIAAMVS
jgi:hypothetical protein